MYSDFLSLLKGPCSMTEAEVREAAKVLGNHDVYKVRMRIHSRTMRRNGAEEELVENHQQ